MNPVKQIFLIICGLYRIRVQAGVLQLTLGIGVVISILCASMILLVYYSQLLFLDQNIDDKLRNNASSGIQYAMGSRTELPFGTSHTIDLFGEEIDTVDIIRRPWGVFELISSTARHHRRSVSRVALIAAPPDKHGKAAVYTPENDGPVYMVGNSSITGTAYLPERKLSTGYINGKDFTGKSLLTGDAIKSKREMLPLDTILVDELVKLVRQENSGYHIRQLDRYPSNADLPFNSTESNYYFTTTQLRLAEKIKGNLIIHCTERLRVAAEAQLSDVILIARDIDIEEGFEGSVQCFATRTITVGKNSVLQYPSALMLMNGSDSLIHIREGAKVNGYVIVPGTDLTIAGRGIFKLDKQSTLHGMAYVNGGADIQGALSGHITTKQFVAIAGTGKYFNHILDGHINGATRSPDLPATLMWANDKELTIAKWLE